MLEVVRLRTPTLGEHMSWQDPHGQSDWRDAYGQYGQDPYSQQYGPEPQDTPPPGYAPDPYAQNPYGQDPYAQYAYGQDPYAQYNQAAYAPVPTSTSKPGVTVAALVANIASAVLCCGVGVAWIPGIILAAMALGRSNTDPDAARKLTIGAWICLAVDIVLTIVAFFLLGLLGETSSSTSP
jgi:hypothetical protein